MNNNKIRFLAEPDSVRKPEGNSEHKIGAYTLVNESLSTESTHKLPTEAWLCKKPIRCGWVGTNKPHYEEYHDQEWGIPVYDDNKHFEMLILEGAQAGLNWETILKKREGYRKAFKNFNPNQVALMSDEELENLMLNPAIIRNRLKIFSARKNAIIFLNIQKEFSSFNNYAWSFVGKKPIINKWKTLKDLPSSSKESDIFSKDLKKRGMKFVGSTIIHAYMQAVGMVNDHLVDCWKYKECIDEQVKSSSTSGLKGNLIWNPSNKAAQE